MRVRADRIFDVPFFEGQVQLASIAGRPFVPITPICTWLHINVQSQARRLARHAERHHLELVTLPDGDAAIPLEDVSWFLRTLRPRIPDPHDRWTRTRQVLCAMLIDFHVRTHNRYFASRARERLIDREVVPQRASHRSRLSTTDAQHMKELQAQGLPLSRISQIYGYSKTAISQICNDRYPVKLRETEDETSDAVYRASLNGLGSVVDGKPRGNEPQACESTGARVEAPKEKSEPMADLEASS